MLATRRAIASAVGLLLSTQPSFAPPAHAASLAPGATGSTDAAALLAIIPDMPFGAPATNATLTAALSREIEIRAQAIERQGARDLAKSPTLSDSWRLIYSNGREISNLAAGLPLGFALGKTYQPLDASTGRFENQGSVENKFGLARASTLVVGDVRIAPPGTLNAAGTSNDAGNRVDVDFRRLVFGLEEVLGQPLQKPLQKVIVTKQKADAPQPANDITYLDATCRITRGGDDSLFIFRREPAPRPLLTAEQRAELYAQAGEDAATGSGKAAAGSPPELRALLKESR